MKENIDQNSHIYMSEKELQKVAKRAEALEQCLRAKNIESEWNSMIAARLLGFQICTSGDQRGFKGYHGYLYMVPTQKKDHNISWVIDPSNFIFDHTFDWMVYTRLWREKRVSKGNYRFYRWGE